MTSAGGREEVGAEAGVRGGGGQREEGAALGPGLRSLGYSWRLQWKTGIHYPELDSD